MRDDSPGTVVAYDGKKLSKYDYEGFFMICENIGFEETYTGVVLTFRDGSKAQFEDLASEIVRVVAK